MKKGFIAALAGASLLAAGLAYAQTIGVPQVTSIGANDLFQDIVGGAPQAGNQYAPASLLGNYSASLAGNNPENWLFGGDATTNLFQRATTGSSVTTTLTYGGPDRWAYWSGTGTAMTVSRSSTAADVPTGYKYAFKMARTSGQTGIVQMCMAQEVESVNSYLFAGQTAEVDFHANPGANFSAAGGAMQVVFISGTGTDEGLSTAAFNYNAGGGGSSTWAGQVNTAVAVNATGPGRYTAVAPIPSTATELAIAICYTPVGTAGTNDYVALSGIQLTRNSALTTVAGTAGASLNVNDPRAKATARRSQAQESLLQYRYYWQIADPAATVPINSTCFVTAANTTVKCGVALPVTMRAAPTTAVSVATSFGIVVTAGTAGTCTTLAATASSNTVNSIGVTCTTGGTIALGSATPLIGAATAGVLSATAEL